jgi:hypothetical protein
MNKIIALILLTSVQICLLLALFGVIYVDFSAYLPSEVNKNFIQGLNVTVRSFLELKIMAMAQKPEKTPYEAWVFLDEVAKKTGVIFKLYDDNGLLVSVPGKKEQIHDLRIIRTIETGKDQLDIQNSTVFFTTALYAEKKCGFCHEHQPGELIGIASLEAPEAIQKNSGLTNLILLVLSFVNALSAAIIILSDPFKHVKELFDKK